MLTKFILILFILLDFLIPILSGPAAALIYIYIMKNNKREHQIPFWIGYVIWQGLVFYLMVFSLGDLAPGPGILTCFLTPVTAVISFIMLWRAQNEVWQANEENPAAQRHYRIGLFLIPGIQMITLVVVLLLGPFMCEIGYNNCMVF